MKRKGFKKTLTGYLALPSGMKDFGYFNDAICFYKLYKVLSIPYILNRGSKLLYKCKVKVTIEEII